MSSLGQPIDVVIADRRDFDRLALELLCDQLPQVVVAASASTVADALRALARVEAAVVLVGGQLVRTDGPHAVSCLRAAGAIRIVLVGTADGDQLRLEAMRVGADGVLHRDGEALALLGVLRGVSGTVPRWHDEHGRRPGAGRLAR